MLCSAFELGAYRFDFLLFGAALLDATGNLVDKLCSVVAGTPFSAEPSPQKG
jgi:hypothetical protein